MNILLNGDERSVVEGSTIGSLVRELGLDPRWVVVEHNLAVPPKDAWDATALSAGDQLEIVRFLGGG